MIPHPMKYLLLTFLAVLPLACSDDDSSNNPTDAPSDVRVFMDAAAGDAPGADRLDGTSGDVSADQAPDTADAATPDLPPAAMLEITPAIRDLGMVTKDSTITMHFTVKNTGGSPSGSLDMKLMNGTLDENAFATVSNGCESALEADATCEVEIRFAANVVGVHQGLLTATASPGGMASAEIKATVVP
jgi:hypothetical protein